MLLRFGFSNFRSFRDQTEVSLIATAQTDKPDFTLDISGSTYKAVPVLGIWGGNASGKSSILEALTFFHWLVNGSHRAGGTGAGIKRQAFLLDPACSALPTTFNMDVIIDNIRYHFGFCVTDLHIEEEWLYSFPSNHRRVLYHRTIDNKNQPSWHFGSHLKGRNKIISELTAPDVLFLTRAAEDAHPQLRDLQKKLIASIHFLSTPKNKGTPYFPRDHALVQPRNRDIITRMLQLADLGVAAFSVEGLSTQSEGAEPLPPRPELVEIQLHHTGTNGLQQPFPLSIESQGTRALLVQIAPILEALEQGHTLVVDELNSSLHPLLCLEIIRFFTDSRSNPKGAQLIFTTHDTSILEHLRRDEVGFTNKGTDGISYFEPLSNYKTRQRDDKRLAYEAGRYGGVPKVNQLITVVREMGDLLRSSMHLPKIPVQDE
jgi:hypothetical protein